MAQGPGTVACGCPRRRRKGLGRSRDSTADGLFPAGSRPSKLHLPTGSTLPTACLLSRCLLSLCLPSATPAVRTGVGGGERTTRATARWDSGPQRLHSVCPVFGLPVQDYEIVQ